MSDIMTVATGDNDTQSRQLIINNLNQYFEYPSAGTFAEALNDYVEYALGFGVNFPIDRADWNTICNALNYYEEHKQIEHAEKNTLLFRIINSACKQPNLGIKKVIFGNYDRYPTTGI